VPELRLGGCRSRPLLDYLKGLGVLRVVAQQADGEARGRWRANRFELASSLDGDGLDQFLRDAYRPASVISPWNGGSGFYPKDRQEALRAIEASSDDRLSAFRAAIGAARQAIADLGLTDKPKPDRKPALVRRLRRSAPDESLAWIDAALVIRGDGLGYPPLLGSGGNDGRFDFSNNYGRCVVECVLEPGEERSQETLAAALWGEATGLKRKLSLAHFSRDGSPNNSPHGEADSLGNPWDLLLAVEGSLLLAAGAVRRHGSELPGKLAAPFTVNATAAGYGSAVDGESGRAELWLPLWEGWATLPELSMLVREARAQVGGARVRQAATGLDFARAAGELGVARGISAFERYAILERAGQSNLAVPAGRVAVAERPAAQALRAIDGWLGAVRRFGAANECPQGPRRAIGQLERAAFELASKGGAAGACATIEAIGALEATLARSSTANGNLRPLRRAPARAWIEAAEDRTPEFAVALGLASLRDPRRSPNERPASRNALPTMRDYLHGTTTGPKGAVEFDPDRSRAVAGQSLCSLLGALHARRHLDAARHPGKTQVSYAEATWVPLEAARLLAAGRLDERRILALLRGLAVLDHGRHRGQGQGRGIAPRQALGGAAPAPEPVFEVLALAWQSPLAGKRKDPRARRALGVPGPGSHGLTIGARPGWASKLAAGAVRAVVEDALLRLRMAGLRPVVTAEDIDPAPRPDRARGQRLAAALLLQLGPHDIDRLVKTYIEREPGESKNGKGTR
jgi:CRISPR-associated protein Csx17